MKKKIITFLLVLCSVFGLSSCQITDGGKDTEKEKDIVLINGFEDVSEMDTLTNHGVLGKVSLNKDNAYVKSGEGTFEKVPSPYPTPKTFVDGSSGIASRVQRQTVFVKIKQKESRIIHS